MKDKELDKGQHPFAAKAAEPNYLETRDGRILFFVFCNKNVFSTVCEDRFRRSSLKD